ncbi:hypothetical protein BH11PLA2_BH11PLA2_18850 [soil metagenome]
MIAPFLKLAMTAPLRQLAFRRLAVGHVLAVTVLMLMVVRSGSLETLGIIAQVLLVLGIVEGSAIIGWRLVQIPKSLAFEFLLVSPVPPRRVFFAEALAGVGRFLWVQLAGLPVLMLPVFAGVAEWPDLWVLAGMPAVWGLVVGITLTAWIYEPKRVRRIGEMFALVGVLFYLVIGLAAAENLGLWLENLPPWLGQTLYDSIIFLNNMNPFGVVRYWFAADRVTWVAEQRFTQLHVFAGIAGLLLAIRAGSRLAGHFQDCHYLPIDSRRASQSAFIGDKPLSWWAVRRVMEYSGRVNLYLAGGFCLAYAAYIVAGDDWPSWMGRMAFILFEKWGGPAMVATAMAVMAAVPAVYQFGLWDPSVQDRCQRLELLLLTDLNGKDYWHAARSAAWSRGRGYLAAALLLWIACAIAGRVTWLDAFGAAFGGLLLWAFAFTVGFRGFATGQQTNGIASLITMGCPLLLYLFWSNGMTNLAAFVPTAVAFLPLKTGLTMPWLAGVITLSAATAWLAEQGLLRCDGDLRRWYDTHQGLKSA